MTCAHLGLRKVFLVKRSLPTALDVRLQASTGVFLVNLDTLKRAYVGKILSFKAIDWFNANSNELRSPVRSSKLLRPSLSSRQHNSAGIEVVVA